MLLKRNSQVGMGVDETRVTVGKFTFECSWKKDRRVSSYTHLMSYN